MGIGLALALFSGCIFVGGIIKETLTPSEQAPSKNPLHKEPPRGRNGQLIIQNRDLWLYDIQHYGAGQAYEWACKGRYNIPDEEENQEQSKETD